MCLKNDGKHKSKDICLQWVFSALTLITLNTQTTPFNEGYMMTLYKFEKLMTSTSAKILNWLSEFIAIVLSMF